MCRWPLITSVKCSVTVILCVCLCRGSQLNLAEQEIVVEADPFIRDGHFNSKDDNKIV